MKGILLRPADIVSLKKQISDYFKTTKYKSYDNYVQKIRFDFRPIRITDDEQGERYILPFDIKDHPMFSKLKEIVEKDNYEVITLTKADDHGGDGINEPIYTKK
jgi:hypothetical protein